MKTDKRLDEAIHAVAKLINDSARDIADPEMVTAFSTYRTLLWARGCREKCPEAQVAKILEAGR